MVEIIGIIVAILAIASFLGVVKPTIIVLGCLSTLVLYRLLVALLQ